MPGSPVHLPGLPYSSPPFSAGTLTESDQSVEVMEQDPTSKSEPAVGGQDGETRDEPTRAPLIRESSGETERPPSAQHAQADSTESQNDTKEVEQKPSEEESDPAERIADFDWENLVQRYHETMKKCDSNEAGLMEEWGSLMDFFRMWANSGHDRETGRTHKRLKTRMSHVQYSEERLEQTRQHYISVVDAFERALNLLNARISSI